MATALSIYQSGWPAITVVVLMMLMGYAANRFWGQGERDFKETLLNISIFLVGYGMQIWTINELQNSVLGKIETYALWKIPDGLGTFFLAYLAVDLGYYWRHRLEHAWGLLWAEHCVHHSSRELNLSTAGRLPWIMIATLWIVYIPFVWFGFKPETLVTCWSLNMGFQFIAHISYRRPTPWFDLILSTPSNHRVHHAENDGYLHRNFGGTFIFWDRIFGTYAAEKAPVRIGCGHPAMGHNPFRVNFLPMALYVRGLFKGGESLRHWEGGSEGPTFPLEKWFRRRSPSRSGPTG